MFFVIINFYRWESEGSWSSRGEGSTERGRIQETGICVTCIVNIDKAGITMI
jgi:hypothetical protein